MRTFLARVLMVHTEERAWRIGADGEEKVGAQLDKLIQRDPRWRAIHAIEVGERGSDIDHLVIGPGGVYSLNAKHHPGAKVWSAATPSWSTDNVSPTYATAATRPSEPASCSPRKPDCP